MKTRASNHRRAWDLQASATTGSAGTEQSVGRSQGVGAAPWPIRTSGRRAHGSRNGEWSPQPVARGQITVDAQSVPQFTRLQLGLRRTLDIVVALVALIFILPLFAIIAALVAFSSPGPVLFKQRRVGQGGELFTTLKFRTMRPGTPERLSRDPVLWAEYVANDYKLQKCHGEITAVGHYLRKLSLDELPQLLNVLRGDMSMVGVRPLVPAEHQGRPAASRELYALLRPGITGLWQVNGRSSVRHGDRIELDDTYIRSWKFRHDLALLARTPVALLKAHHSS